MSPTYRKIFLFSFPMSQHIISDAQMSQKR